MGVDLARFTLRPVKVPGTSLQIISVARLTERKGLHVAIEACRQLKARGVDFRYHILGIGPWERRLRTLIEQYQAGRLCRHAGLQAEPRGKNDA